MKSTMKYPEWQHSLRMAVEGTTRMSYQPTTDAERQDAIYGQRLHAELRHLFGIPIPEKTLMHNLYVVDGYTFQLKTVDDGNAAEPVFASTQTLTTGTKYNKKEAAVTYTLYVGRVQPDPDFDGWPQPHAVVVKNFNLNYGNPIRIRAALMNAIEMLDAEYAQALEAYCLWKVTANREASEMQDFFLQLIRRALANLPRKTIEEYDVMLDAEEAIAHMDGMLIKVDTFEGPDDDDDFDDDGYDDEDDDDDFLAGHEHDDLLEDVDVTSV